MLLGKGDGTFQPGQSYAVSTVSVAVGDFNGDGIPDLAVADVGFDPSYYPSTLRILLGNGDSTFRATPSFFAGSGVQAVVVVDLNGDGKQDLVTSNFAYNFYQPPGRPPLIEKDVRAFLGDGQGTFQLGTIASAGSSPGAMAVGDFNRDGILDLAVADPGIDDGTLQDPDNRVSILLGNGDGTFQAARSNIAGFRPMSVAVCDFNGDGNPDLAVANAYGGPLSVLLGNGDGTFQPAQNYPIGGSTSVVLADFNRDGKLDIAVAAESGAISILLGNGDGTFQTAQSYAAGVSLAVMVGDFNGDGFPDLAVRSIGGVTVLLNAADWGH